MKVESCGEVKNPGDWCFFTDTHRYIKAMLPIEPVVLTYETAGDMRVVCLPVSGPQAWTWNGSENAPTLSPSIKTEIVIGHTTDNPPKPIMKEIWHGNLEEGIWKPPAP